MLRLRTLAVAAFMAIACGAVQAQTTYTINFDTLPNGATVASGTTITNQYAAYNGAVFTPDTFFLAGTNMQVTSTDVGGGYTAAHGNILHTFGGWLNEADDPSFDIDFTANISSISVTFVGDTSGASLLAAYRRVGNNYTFVNSAQTTASATAVDKTLTLSNLVGVNNISILPGDFLDWVGVDNIRFTVAASGPSAVPEPSQALGLGVGVLTLVALTASARRRRRTA